MVSLCLYGCSPALREDRDIFRLYDMKNSEKLNKIKVIAMDCDGTLTDGKMVFLGSEQMKFFNAQDGLGITIARKCGFIIVWVTGSSTPAIMARGKMLGVHDILDGCANKADAMDMICEKYNVSCDEIAYIGDDLNDTPALKKAGFGAVTVNGVKEAKDLADYVTERHGGEGAVREVIELILKAQNKWEDVVNNFENYTFAQKKIVQ